MTAWIHERSRVKWEKKKTHFVSDLDLSLNKQYLIYLWCKFPTNYLTYGIIRTQECLQKDLRATGKKKCCVFILDSNLTLKILLYSFTSEQVPCRILWVFHVLQPQTLTFYYVGRDAQYHSGLFLIQPAVPSATHPALHFFSQLLSTYQQVSVPKNKNKTAQRLFYHV